MHGPKEASYDVLTAKLALVTGASVLVPDYPLVPVGDYQKILAFLSSAWQWLSQHGPNSEDCSAAPTPPLFLAGDSSGAASAMSLLLQLHGQANSGSPLADGFFAFSPWVNLECDTPAYYSNAYATVSDVVGKEFVGDILFRGAPQNNSDSLRGLALQYLVDENLLKDPQASPMFASEEQLADLPPVYFAVSGTEILGGDGIIMANRIARRGVAAYLDIFVGMWHGFEQNSEGCGSGSELWQGSLALSHAGDFVMQLVKHLSSGNGGSLPASLQQTPRTTVHYPHAADAKPWVPIVPLTLGFVDIELPAAPAASAASVAATLPPVTATLPPATVPPLVVPRALPSETTCSSEDLIGASMTGFLGGSVFSLVLILFTSWFLSRRAHRELPEWLPTFLKHPFENHADENRNFVGAGTEDQYSRSSHTQDQLYAPSSKLARSDPVRHDQNASWFG